MDMDELSLLIEFMDHPIVKNICLCGTEELRSHVDCL